MSEPLPQRPDIPDWMRELFKELPPPNNAPQTPLKEPEHVE